MAVHTIDVRDNFPARNDEVAMAVRQRLGAAGVTALNIVGAPGAGKTMLLERTVRDVGESLDMAVAVADIASLNDTERVARHTDRPVQAMLTHGASHLGACHVASALDAVDLAATRLLLIENVGDLVCPASWDLGEQAKVIVYSVTDGEDKPLKYARLFRKARYVVLNKIDLLPHVRFDAHLAVRYAHGVNPELTFFRVSALTGEGMDDWYAFLRGLVPAAHLTPSTTPGIPAHAV